MPALQLKIRAGTARILLIDVMESALTARWDEIDFKDNVYNLGGGRKNSISIIEAIGILNKNFEIKLDYEVTETSRIGDHQWYITDTTKLNKRFGWAPSMDINAIISEIVSTKR